jgi:hypothetical protein
MRMLRQVLLRVDGDRPMRRRDRVIISSAACNLSQHMHPNPARLLTPLARQRLNVDRRFVVRPDVD